MAEVISFELGARRRRRQREIELNQQCAEILELNLRLALEIYHHAPPHERAIRARHVRQLAEMLEYVAGEAGEASGKGNGERGA